ncbi:MAG TPA: hypothetical protein VNA24_37915, partial [Hyalangium sp.]|nr:hypothetical protein [Hyalangium sp.]
MATDLGLEGLVYRYILRKILPSLVPLVQELVLLLGGQQRNRRDLLLRYLEGPTQQRLPVPEQ